MPGLNPEGTSVLGVLVGGGGFMEKPKSLNDLAAAMYDSSIVPTAEDGFKMALFLNSTITDRISPAKLRAPSRWSASC